MNCLWPDDKPQMGISWKRPLRNLQWTNLNWKLIFSMFISKYELFKLPYYEIFELWTFQTNKNIDSRGIGEFELSTSKPVVRRFIHFGMVPINVTRKWFLYKTKHQEVTSAAFYFCQIFMEGLSSDSQQPPLSSGLRKDFVLTHWVWSFTICPHYDVMISDKWDFQQKNGHLEKDNFNSR